jgi:hypothetical protein
MTDKEALRMALEALELNNDEWKSLADSGDCGFWNAEDQDHYKQTNEAITACEQALAAPVQPVARKWHQAPVKTSWGHDMVVADLAIDKDHTVSVYCERDQKARVEAMFTTPPAAKRQWVGLTEQERNAIEDYYEMIVGKPVFDAIEAKLKERNQ